MENSIGLTPLGDHLSAIFSGSFPFACYGYDNRTGEILYFNSQFCNIWKIPNFENFIGQNGMTHQDVAKYLHQLVIQPTKLFSTYHTSKNHFFMNTLEDEIYLSSGEILRQFYFQAHDPQHTYLGDVYIFEEITLNKLKSAICENSHEIFNPPVAEQTHASQSFQYGRMNHEDEAESSSKNIFALWEKTGSLTGLAEKIMHAPDLDALLEIICKEVAVITSASITNISLLDEKKDELVHAKSYGDPLGLLKQISGFSGMIYRAYVATRGLINIIPNILEIPFIPGNAIYKKLGVSTTATIPLIYGKKLLGSMNLFFTRENHLIDKDQQKALRALSILASLCISNSIANKEVQRKSWELEVLGEISDNLLKTESTKEMLWLIIQTAKKCFHAETVLISLPTPPTFEIITESSDNNLTVNKLSENFSKPFQRLMDQQGEFYLSNFNDKLRTQLESLSISLDPSIVSLAVIQMKSLDHPIGLLGLGFKIKQEFNSSQIGLIRALANISANSLSRASLVETLETHVAERTKTLSLLFEISKIASSTLNRQSILSQSLKKTIFAVHASVGAIDLVDAGGKILIPISVVDQNQVHPNNMNFSKIHNPLALKVFREGVVKIEEFKHTSDDKGNLDSPAKVFYIGIPITIRDKTLGVLSLYRPDTIIWNEEEISLLNSVAEQIAVVLENYDLREKAEKSVVKEERTRLARELHDSVTQSLYSLSLFAEAGKQSLSVDNHERLKQNLSMIADTAHQSLKEMRLLVYELRPPELDKIGLVGTLRKRLDAIEKRVGVKVIINANNFSNLPVQIENALYRIAQEALNNSLKHAKATMIEILIRNSSSGFKMEISDNGVGFQPDRIEDLGGMGLPIIRERAQHIGAHIEIISSPGSGTKVEISLPFKLEK